MISLNALWGIVSRKTLRYNIRNRERPHCFISYTRIYMKHSPNRRNAFASVFFAFFHKLDPSLRVDIFCCPSRCAHAFDEFFRSFRVVVATRVTENRSYTKWIRVYNVMFREGEQTDNEIVSPQTARREKYVWCFVTERFSLRRAREKRQNNATFGRIRKTYYYYYYTRTARIWCKLIDFPPGRRPSCFINS